MECKQTLKGDAGVVYSVSWAPEGPFNNQLVTGTSKGAVQVWDVSSGVKRASVNLYSPAHAVYRVAWNPHDGQRILTAGADGSVYDVSPIGEVRWRMGGWRVMVEHEGVSDRACLCNLAVAVICRRGMGAWLNATCRIAAVRGKLALSSR